MGKSVLSIAGASMLVVLGGCGGITEITRQQVARSDTAVKQAQAAIGNSEAGAIELQQAKDRFAAAQQAVEKKDDVQAQRLAVLAELDAQLAITKSQSAGVRRAANELNESIQALKEQTQRGTTPR